MYGYTIVRLAAANFELAEGNVRIPRRPCAKEFFFGDEIRNSNMPVGYVSETLLEFKGIPDALYPDYIPTSSIIR